MKVELESILGELRRRFHELYGDRLVQMILFGSQARGDAVEGSDIDVLVVLKGSVWSGEEIRRTSDIRVDLSLEYRAVVSCVYVSEERFRREQSPLLLNVRREGVPL